ncbi:DUF461 domain-containing protein [Streptomyces sp. TRM 70351]|uniref:DUF461 domain-containing protein n=1 Tax=Streptomyces sp. TRM 70351 TaxID=3116552 RepID=UPI002E7BF777|nr:DUF461 domain-containing protein [Streptomyces sp. TRM 70351]MEE1929711.1 DUF461 domain-containing protein [Streptomyces sp. TRM 70351]
MSSSRSSLRRGVTAAAIALSTLSLAACGAGLNAQTNQIRPDNASEAVGDIKLQNVSVITTEDGEGPAAISALIFNGGDEDETLQAVTFTTGDGSGRAELSPAEGGTLTVPAGGHLMLGGEGNASAVVENAGQQGISDGAALPVTFQLSSTGSIELRPLVYPETMLTYGEFGPTPAASPEPTGEDATGQPEDGTEGEPGSEDTAGPDAEEPGTAESGTPEGTEAGDGTEGGQDEVPPAA